MLALMLQAPPSYRATVVLAGEALARVNDAGAVAGVAWPPGADGPTRPEAFVWRGGKTVWRDKAYPMAAGPNAKGQVALGSDKGLFVWTDGKVRELSKATPVKIIGIDDEGVVVAVRGDGGLFVWPPSEEGQARFTLGMGGTKPGEAPTRSIPLFPIAPVAYSPDGGYVAQKRPIRASQTDGLLLIGTRAGMWSYDFRRSFEPGSFGRNGYLTARLDFGNRPGLWHNGYLSELPAPSGATTTFLPSDALRGVNGRGEVVGSYGGRGTVWTGGAAIDLSRATDGGKWRIDAGMDINERGDILALGLPAKGGGSPSLLLLRRR